MRVQFGIKHLLWLVVVSAVFLALVRIELRAAVLLPLFLLVAVGVLASGAIIGERVFADVERRLGIGERWSRYPLRLLVSFVAGLGTMLLIWYLGMLFLALVFGGAWQANVRE